MAHLLTTTDNRIGAVENPLADGDEREDLVLDADKTLTVEDQELAEAIVDAYDFMVYASPSADTTESESSDEAEAEAEDDVELCGTEMNDGDVCERPADECPYH